MDEIKITQRAGAVTCDFDGIKAMLDKTLEEYRGAVFTEDSKKDAKAVVAELRKNKKEFQERIKVVKAEYMKPYDDFYAKAIELVNMFDEPINFINDQVQQFETKRREEKIKLIEEIYKDAIENYEDAPFMALQLIYNKKWENATCNKNTILKEIEEWKVKISADVLAIKSMKSDVEKTALDMYKKSLSINDCIIYINQYEEAKKTAIEKERERVKREEEERIRKEERERVELERKVEEEKQAAVSQAEADIIETLTPEDTDEPAETYTFMLKLTSAAKDTLETYLNSVGIEYDVMDDLPI